MESSTHRRLKSLAVEWLFDIGCRAVAVEVACPIGRYRVDAAGWLDHAEGDDLPSPDPTWRLPPAADERGAEAADRDVENVSITTSPPPAPELFPTTEATSPTSPGASAGSSRRRSPRGPRSPRLVVVECKQSRADFFRNHVGREGVLAERERLERLARRIEERRIKRHEPHLRRIEAGLFEDRETWNFQATSIGAYHRIRERLDRVDRDLYGRSKFDLLVRYRLADHVVVLAPRGLIRPRELPPSWGLLECSRRQRLGRAEPGERLRTRRRPDRLESDDGRRQRFLRNIAASASRAALKAGAYES
ncbi:MAG: hypothetical protein ACO3YY_01165 [Phycisphaerales bacterium]|jgi:hypothetical protein|nr:hypothetical protein [Planctomycetota bacterium]